MTENQHVLISQVILRVGPNGCENQILHHKISNPRISERPIWSIISIEKFIWVLIFLHISHFEQNFSIWTSNFQIFRKNVFYAKSNPKHFWGLLRSWINQDQCEKYEKLSEMSYFDLFEPSDFGEPNWRQHGEEGCYKWCRVDQELVKHECNES